MPLGWSPLKSVAPGPEATYKTYLHLFPGQRSRDMAGMDAYLAASGAQITLLRRVGF